MAKKKSVAKKKAVKRKTVVKKKTVKRKAVIKKKAVTKKKTVVKKKAVKKAGAKRTSGLNSMTYSLSPALQAIVGNKRLTRPQIVKGLWDYIKAKNCQDPKNKRMIVPDAHLEAVLGKQPVDMLKMAGLLNKHILS
ncbi:MAG: SWIB/MDM2 domain-containing protein [Chlamydiae bacterium]|nr:SWIB/MDM2 domain-containing protein [Chlamydiota bacterium]